MAGVATGIPIFIRHLGETLSIPVPGDGTVTDVKIATGAVTDAKIIGMAASKLTGTIAGARLPDPLPAISGASLTGIIPADASVTNAKTDFLPGTTFKGDGSSVSGKIIINCEMNTHGVSIQSPAHSSAAAYTLTLPPTAGSAGESLTTDGSGVLSFAAAGGGKVVQIVRTDHKTVGSTSTTFTSRLTTVPQNTLGAEFFTATITPASTSNILLFHINMTCMGDGDGRQVYAALFRDSVASALSSSANFVQSTDPVTINFTHSMTAPSTSAQTYKVRAGAGVGNFYINQRHVAAFHGGTASSGLTIIEYTPPA
jgi:hypothetical protein